MSAEHVKSAVDVLSISTVVATIAGWLPAVAALMTVIWTGIRILETRTVRMWVMRWRCREAGCRFDCVPGCDKYQRR